MRSVVLLLLTLAVCRSQVSPTLSGEEGEGARTSARVALDTYKGEQAGRPEVEVRGREAMVVCSHPLAAQAGARVLMSGGNAVDAAVAAGLALNVTEPRSCGVGGDTVMLIYWAKTGEFFALDGYSKVPAHPGLREMLATRADVKNNPEAFKEEPRHPRQVRSEGILTAMVPGTTAAWTRAMERFGTKTLKEVFAPGIGYAKNGFAVDSYFSYGLELDLANFDMLRYPFVAETFYPGGKPLKAGDVLVQKDLAATLRKIAEGGFDAFYKGDIARKIARYAQHHGGVITEEDLANYDVVWRDPARTTYRGYEVIAAPPPTAGIHLLQQLNIVENYELAKMGYHSADGLHVMIEACKLAGADRRGLAGGPDFVPMPQRGLLSKKYAADRKGLIKMQRARAPKYDPGKAQTYESEDTTHFVVRDRWGNMVSCTTTLGNALGCKEVIAGTGIFLVDRTWFMALGPPSPNRVAPNRRANIGHSPAMIFKEGRPFMAIGSPGGDGIRQTVFQAIVHVIDFGFNIQRAIEAPRFTCSPLANRVSIDTRISEDVLAELEKRGHHIVHSAPWGAGDVAGLTIDPGTGVIMGGYDPRRNSIAVGW